MRSSRLMMLLCNAGLPVLGYDFEQHSLSERDVMVQQLSAKVDTVVTTNPAVTLLENEAEQAIYLITQPGHFAHPSIIRRSLIMNEGVRSIQVKGFTAALPETMSAWLSQFRVQDELVTQSLVR